MPVALVSTLRLSRLPTSTGCFRLTVCNLLKRPKYITHKKIGKNQNLLDILDISKLPNTNETPKPECRSNNKKK